LFDDNLRQAIGCTYTLVSENNKYLVGEGKLDGELIWHLAGGMDEICSEQLCYTRPKLEFAGENRLNALTPSILAWPALACSCPSIPIAENLQILSLPKLLAG